MGNNHIRSPEGVSPARAFGEPDRVVSTPLTPLVGRSQEIEEISTLVSRSDVRLLVLAGPGGVGKTRLALEVANAAAGQFNDSVEFVDLSSVHDARYALLAIARVLGQENDTIPAEDWLKRTFQRRPLLLVVDNVEQLLPHVAPQVASLIAACPGLTAVVTSRETLHVRGEHVFQVSSLDRPELNPGQQVDLSTASASPAVQLFVERARDVDAGFDLSSSNVSDVAEICARLDGLPLAIELAAVRASMFTPRELLERLQQPLAMLTDGQCDLPSRHRTFRAAVAWSADLLEPPERSLFRRLAVFDGSFSLEACEHVSGLGGQAIDLLSSLVRKNLVTTQRADSPARSTQDNVRTRFQLLQTVRGYAAELLASDQDERCEVLRRHATYYLDLAERANDAIIGPDQAGALDLLGREIVNVRAALKWTVNETGEAEIALRLVRALGLFWYARGYLVEARRWLSAALALSVAAPPHIRGKALTMACYIATRQGDFQDAVRFGEQSLRLLEAADDYNEWVYAHGIAGIAALEFGDLDRAEQLLSECLAMARLVNYTWHSGGALWGLSRVALQRGDLLRARRLAEESLSRWTALGDREGSSLVMDVLAEIARGEGDLARARQINEESLAHRDELGDRPGRAISLRSLAGVALCRREYEQARSLYTESVHITRDVGDQAGLVTSLEGLATVASKQGRFRLVVKLMSSAKQARTRFDISDATRSPDIPDTLAIARERLSPEQFATAWSAGEALSTDETIELALNPDECNDTDHEQPHEHELTETLTPREEEILRLVFEGLTNPEIAEEICISRGTVRIHVSNILGKLGASTRTEAVRLAQQRGLIDIPGIP